MGLVSHPRFNWERMPTALQIAHLHWGSTVTHVHSPVQASHSTASNSTSTQPFKRISCLWNWPQNKHTGAQKAPTLLHIPSRAVCMWWLMALSADSKKMVMLRKQQSVCCNLTCNSSGGLLGEAWGTERCLNACVVVCWTVWLRVCMYVSKCDELGGSDCQPYIRASDGTNQSPSRP